MKVINQFAKPILLLFMFLGMSFQETIGQTSYNISTIAGTGTSGFSEGATASQLNKPGSIALDAQGNLYIADILNYRVRKVNLNTGNITTVAGNGTSGFSGDDGLAVDAQISVPGGIAVNASGTLLYIADKNNHCIRKVDLVSGIITTFAGTNTAGYSGDGLLATSSKLDNPIAVALDATGNLYIADRNNHRVRLVNASTNVLIDIAGTGVAGFSGDGGLASVAQIDFPVGVAVDQQSNLYIADANNSRIRKVNLSSGNISTVAGNGSIGFSGDGGLATDAALHRARQVAVDAQGNLYITDLDNQRIRKVDAVTKIITTIAGTGVAGFSGDGNLATLAQLHMPRGVQVDASGNIFIADRDNHRIRKIDITTSNISTIAGTGTAGFSVNLATSAQLNQPGGVAVDNDGNIYIADSHNHRIRKILASTGEIVTIAGDGTANFGGDGGLATAAQLNTPGDVAVDASGNLYIADKENHRIRKIDAATQMISTVAGTGIASFSGDGLATSVDLNSPVGVAVDGNNDVYIADRNNHRIRKLEVATEMLSTIAGTGISGGSGDGGLATAARINLATGIAVNSAGDIFIADRNSHRVRKVDAVTKIITTVAGTGTFGFSGDGNTATLADLGRVRQVAVDASGNIFIADLDNQRIRKVIAGNIVTVAGTGVAGFSGDGGLATLAMLNNPRDIAVDAQGNLLIADRENHRIRKLTLNASQRVSNIATLKHQEMVMYPNPSSRLVTIKLGDMSVDKVALKVVDIQGHSVAVKVVRQTGQIKLMVNHLKPGFYWVTISGANNQRSFTKALLIQR